MERLFGIPMDALAVACLVAFALVMGVVAALAPRKRGLALYSF